MTENKSQLVEIAQLRGRLENLDNELARTHAERAADRAMHELHVRLSREPKRIKEEQEQSAKDRKTFHEAAHRYGFSVVEANFQLLRSILGPDFTVEEVGQAVSQLAPCSQQEKQQRAIALEQQQAKQREQAAQEYKELLLNAAPHELRQIAKSESEQRRIEAQQKQDAEQVRIRQEKDQAHGFPPLPVERTDGTKLDARFFMRQSASELRHYIKKFGAAQITARLRGN